VLEVDGVSIFSLSNGVVLSPERKRREDVSLCVLQAHAICCRFAFWEKKSSGKHLREEFCDNFFICLNNSEI
jgi:hypothetical protein